MVDFDAEGTVGTPPSELLNYILIEAWYQARLAWKKYFENISKTGSAKDYHLSANMKDLFLSVRRMLKKDLTEEEYRNIRLRAFSDDPNTLLEVFEELDDYLQSKRLTKLDIKKKVDYNRPEAVNRAHGFG